MYSDNFSLSMTEVNSMKGGSMKSNNKLKDNIITLDFSFTDSENPFIATEEYKKVLKGGSLNNLNADSDSLGVTYNGGGHDDSSSDLFENDSDLLDEDFSTSSSSTDEIIDKVDFENSEESDFTSYEKYKKSQKKSGQKSYAPHHSQSSDKMPSSDEKKSKYVFSESSEPVMSNKMHETSSINTSDVQVLNVKSAYNKQARSKKVSKKKKGSKKGSKY
jgi:hypothetical protein